MRAWRGLCRIIRHLGSGIQRAGPSAARQSKAILARSCKAGRAIQLVEGNSLRAVSRMTDVHRTTIMKLLCDLGRACSEHQDKVFNNLSCKRIQCDEIWSFVYAKDRNCPVEQKAKGGGDALDVGRD
jgi:hypothetical protein